MKKNKIIIGSRGSDLALWQANYVKKKLQELQVEAEIKVIKTSGDIFLEKSLQQGLDKGAFTKEIEEELLKKEIDVAVHSLKDLPTEMPTGLQLTAVSEREACADLLLVHPSATEQSNPLPVKENSIIGATSLRRQSLLRKFAPSLKAKMLRGNVPSRIKKLRDGQYQAIILAEAGIKRLKLVLDDLIVYRLNPLLWLPAPAQGVLGLQSRIDDVSANELLQTLHHPDTFTLVNIERQLLRHFEGGCHSAFGAWANYEISPPKGLTTKKIRVLLGHENSTGHWQAKEILDKEANILEEGFKAVAFILSQSHQSGIDKNISLVEKI